MRDKETAGYLRPMTSGDLDAILKLRNHSEIRRYMLTQHEISSEEHMSWFIRSSQVPTTKLLVFEMDQKCYGFVQFKETGYQGVMDWGFYASPDSPKGTGRILGIAAIKNAFEDKRLYKICGQAISGNQPSIGLHMALGFAEEGILRDQHFDGTKYHDMICFGLLRREWEAGELHKDEVNDQHR